MCRAIFREPGISAAAHALRPESTGSVHVTSADGAAAPAIRFNFLSAALDREDTLEVTRLARAIMDAASLAGIIDGALEPGPDVVTDDEIMDWARNAGATCFHPVGTCKMGSDPMVVVDDRLRVHGIDALRVADASIMPTLTSGNINAPSIMIGEKAARMVMEGRDIIQTDDAGSATAVFCSFEFFRKRTIHRPAVHFIKQRSDFIFSFRHLSLQCKT